MSAATLLPSERPTAPMDDDEDGAPTEFWRRPEDNELVAAVTAWPSAISPPPRPRPAARRTTGGSVAPVALDVAPRSPIMLRVPASSSGGRTLAMGAVVIGAACFGLALGHLARRADLDARAASGSGRTESSLAIESPREAPAAAPTSEAIAIDSLPDAPVGLKAPQRAGSASSTATPGWPSR